MSNLTQSDLNFIRAYINKISKFKHEFDFRINARLHLIYLSK